jgi:hypothetical protein
VSHGVRIQANFTACLLSSFVRLHGANQHDRPSLVQPEGISANGAAEAEDSAKVEADVEATLEPLPPKLLNNAAVLHMRVGDIPAGAALFQEALEVILRRNP